MLGVKRGDMVLQQLSCAATLIIYKMCYRDWQVLQARNTANQTNEACLKTNKTLKTGKSVFYRRIEQSHDSFYFMQLPHKSGRCFFLTYSNERHSLVRKRHKNPFLNLKVQTISPVLFMRA